MIFSNPVTRHPLSIMLLNKEFLDTLTAQAQASPRLRQHFDLRNSEHDQSQRMLNALEPGTVLPIHRHLHSSESVAMLRGKAFWIFYDGQGHETSRHLIEAGGENPGIVVPNGITWNAWRAEPSSGNGRTGCGNR